MRKILIVYPFNFLLGSHGTDAYVSSLAYMLKEIGFDIDYLGLDNFHLGKDFEDFEHLNSDRLISRLFLYDYIKGYNNDTSHEAQKKENKKHSNCTERNLNTLVNENMLQFFNDIVEQNHYDVILITYNFLADLLKEYESKAKTAYLMIDSQFLQQFFLEPNTHTTLGCLIDEEIERLNYYDEIFCISYDEKQMFEKLLGKKMHFFPHLQSDDIPKSILPLEDRKWDIMFIGYNNAYNVEGLNWFLNDVYLYLDIGIRIVLVGTSTNEMEVKHSNIDIIPFAPDLEEIYSNAKISICPMFRGTGMKIKVVESMARGIPIVCSELGVDGFPDKTESGCLVTNDPVEFAWFINKLLADKAFYAETVDKSSRYYDKMFSKEKYKKLLQEVLLR